MIQSPAGGSSMGTAMKFVVGVLGVLFVCLGLGIVSEPLYEVLSDPHDIDFPGGAFGIVLLILLGGSAPFLIGGFLLRKAMRKPRLEIASARADVPAAADTLVSAAEP